MTACRRSLCLYASALLVSSVMAFGQTVTGTVSGQVTDPSGAVVPHAQVTVENTATGVKTTVTSNDAGAYSVRFLPIGPYKVTASASGFSTVRVPEFQLEIDQNAKVDAHMTIGALAQVEVEGAIAPILDTTDGTIGLSLTANQIATIPLNGRNFSSVTLYQPGAVDSDPAGLTGANATERNTQSNGIVAVNGNRAQANNYTLDGIDMNEGQNNLIGYNPAPDAIAEIKVITADAPATYGNVNGGDVVAVLKSGTNKFHGSAYGYVEDQDLEANSWGNKHQPEAVNPATGVLGPNPIKINPFTQGIFGGTFGGPIKRDKLFFFGDYEGTRSHQGGTSQASVFTQAMRNGDFSAVQAVNGTQLLDTQNNFAPYVNNQIPIVNPVAKYLFANPTIYPLPNSAPQDGLVQYNYRGATREFRVNNQYDIKIEADPRASDKITGFYAQSGAYDFNTNVLAISFPGESRFPTKLGGGTWVHTFSPSIVNEGRVGFTRVVWNQGVPSDPTGQFGYTGNQKVGIAFGTQLYEGFSDQSIHNNFSDVGTPGEPQILRDNTFYYGDNLTIQKGRQLFSLGVQAIRYQQNYSPSGAQGALGQFTYTGNYSGVGSATYGGADFVLDRAQQSNIELSGGGLFGNRQWRTAEFIEDDWKVTDKLSLTFGVRYEYDETWKEAHNRTANVILGTDTVEYAGSVPTGAPAGSIVCDNPGCYEPTYNQVMPRFGFAYEVSPRWVVRGGYGATSFFEGDSNNQRLTYQSPFLAFSKVSANTPVQAAGTTPYSPGNPLAVENGFAVNSLTNLNSGFGAWPQHQQPAYVHEFNLTTEYELSNSTSLSLAYVGETGQHLADYRNGNQLTLAQSADIAALPSGAAIPAADAAPYAGLVGQGGALLITESEAGMNFNAFETTLRHRETNGLSWTVNYTYGHAFTNSAGNYGAPNINGQNGAFENGYNGHADYGPTGQDVRHNASAIAAYAVPYGRGLRYGSSANRVLDLALGGWTVSASGVIYSGFPITLSGPDNTSTSTYGAARPDQYRKMHIHGRSVANWWGTDPSAVPCAGADNGVCAYGPELPFQFGTAPVGSERSPDYKTIDTSASKDFHITEGQAVGFRADAFNVGNIVSYGNPDSGIQDGAGSYGQITSARSSSRVLQLGLHYTF